MSVVTCEIELSASPEDVWDTVMNPNRFADWVTIHRDVSEISEGAPREGFKMKQTLCLRGVPFHVSWKLEECEAARHAKWVGRGPARSRAETEYTLTPSGAGTRFEYRNEFRAPLGPLGAVASRAIVGGVPEREARASLRRLQSLVDK
ncbi:MAG: hypothetical protein NVSMB51_18020 [Solirubrobacteraceae bacterium]